MSAKLERGISYHTLEVLAVSSHLLDLVILRLDLNLDGKSLDWDLKLTRKPTLSLSLQLHIHVRRANDALERESHHYRQDGQVQGRAERLLAQEH